MARLPVTAKSAFVHVAGYSAVEGMPPRDLRRGVSAEPRVGCTSDADGGRGDDRKAAHEQRHRGPKAGDGAGDHACQQLPGVRQSGEGSPRSEGTAAAPKEINAASHATGRFLLMPPTVVSGDSTIWAQALLPKEISTTFRPLLLMQPVMLPNGLVSCIQAPQNPGMRLLWTIDALMIQGEDNMVVSNPVSIDLPGSGPCKFQVKLFAVPRRGCSGKGFRGSCGWGRVEVRCLDKPACGTGKVDIHLAVGTGEYAQRARVPVAHDFARQACCGRSSMRNWNFRAATDPIKGTVDMCIDILPSSAKQEFDNRPLRG